MLKIKDIIMNQKTHFSTSETAEKIIKKPTSVKNIFHRFETIKNLKEINVI